jgi:hypothetical protein
MQKGSIFAQNPMQLRVPPFLATAHRRDVRPQTMSVHA